MFKMIGYTKGNSVKDISTDIVKLCSNYLKTNYGLEYPSKKKFIIIQNEKKNKFKYKNY